MATAKAKTKPAKTSEKKAKETKPKTPTARKPMTDEAIAKALKSLHGCASMPTRLTVVLRRLE